MDLLSRNTSSRSRWNLPARYTLREHIGSGAYGSVCEAYDREEKKLVAIKRVGHLFDDLVDCKRILREISILSKLSHDGVVKLLDIPTPIFPVNFNELFIVMEICDSDLKKLCRTNVQLKQLQVNTLLYNILEGLRYLHSACIYHRDLKPANILVNRDCTIKICDFGLARAFGGHGNLGSMDPANMSSGSPTTSDDDDSDGQRPRVTRNLTGHVVTRWYRAFEVILLQQDYTNAIDIWSAGCIHAELLGMLPGYEYEKRGPLFPGNSCFPLTPDNHHRKDHKFYTRGNHDMLNMIFNLLGTPAEEDIELLQNTDAKKYVRCFSPRIGTGIAAKFPQVCPKSIELLERMLRFNPQKRITAQEALAHDVFESATVRDSASDQAAPQQISLDFEAEDNLDEQHLRKYFLREIQQFHPKSNVLH